MARAFAVFSVLLYLRLLSSFEITVLIPATTLGERIQHPTIVGPHIILQ